MSIGIETTRQFLSELMRCTQGDPQAKISMYEVGAALGLEKAEAGKLAEDVIAEGWAEIKTLSGDIGITPDGIEASGGTAAVGDRPQALSMGKGPIIQNDGRTAVEQILGQVQERLISLSLPYDTLEEIVMDIKTTRVQLLSPKPKTAIMKAVLGSLGDAMHSAGASDTAAQIKNLINE
jgi:hypothetical protein